MSIAIDGVVAGYTRDVPILTGVSLEVASGEIVTILGPNGSGKSTLLKTMMGFLRPSAGKISVDGESVAATPVHRRATECGLGIVPQLANVFGALTVRQNLEIGGATLPRRERRRRVAELLDLYPRLRERQGQRADLQSGGERQMLAVARALMTRPGHLLLDEPSAGLSPLMLNELFDMLRELRDRDGTTLLVVEQNAAQSLKSSDRGVVLAAGKVAIDAPAAELLRDTRVSELYLGGAIYGQ